MAADDTSKKTTALSVKTRIFLVDDFAGSRTPRPAIGWTRNADQAAAVSFNAAARIAYDLYFVTDAKRFALSILHLRATAALDRPRDRLSIFIHDFDVDEG